MKCEKHQIRHDPRWPCPECAKEEKAKVDCPATDCSPFVTAEDELDDLLALVIPKEHYAASLAEPITWKAEQVRARICQIEKQRNEAHQAYFEMLAKRDRLQTILEENSNCGGSEK